MRPALFDLAARLRLMDRFEDYVQILSLTSPGLEEWAPGPAGVDLARLTETPRLLGYTLVVVQKDGGRGTGRVLELGVDRSVRLTGCRHSRPDALLESCLSGHVLHSDSSRGHLPAVRSRERRSTGLGTRGRSPLPP